MSSYVRQIQNNPLPNGMKRPRGKSVHESCYVSPVAHTHPVTVALQLIAKSNTKNFKNVVFSFSVKSSSECKIEHGAEWGLLDSQTITQ